MRVHRAFVEAEWPTKAHQFPGVEIGFENESDDGMADLLVTEGDVAPEVIAGAVHATPLTPVVTKPAKPAIAADFIDHGRERRLADMQARGLIHVPDEAIEPEPESSVEEVSAGGGGTKVEAEEAPKPKAKRKSPPKKAAPKKKAAAKKKGK